jgi:hypothetical protein
LRRPRQGCQTFRALLYSSIDMGTLHLQRPVFNYISWLPGVKFSPRGELGPHGLTLSHSWGLFFPLFTPRGEHTLMFWRTKEKTEFLHPYGLTSPLGANFTPRGQLHP